MRAILQEKVPNRQNWCSEGRGHFSQLAMLPSVLTCFEMLGYTVLTELDRNSRQLESEAGWGAGVIFHERLRQSLKRINLNVPEEAIALAIQQLSTPPGEDLLQRNYQVHTWLTQGMSIAYQLGNQWFSHTIWLIDRVHLLTNDWLVIQPLTTTEKGQSYCLDLVVFINGLPLVVIQGLVPVDAGWSLQDAYRQVQIYKQGLPTLLAYNTMMVLTDGHQARVGTLTSCWQEFMPWLTIDGEDVPVTAITELDVLIQGIFDRRRLLELVQYFIWFEQRDTGMHKAMVNYPTCPLRNLSGRYNRLTD